MRFGRPECCKGQAEEVPDAREDSNGHHAKGHFCYSKTKTLYCVHALRRLSKNELKHNGLINLVEDVSKRQRIQATT